MPTLKELSPALWFSMHTFAGAYPDVPSKEQKSNAINFIKSLQTLMPCPKCTTHLKEYLTKNPIEYSVNNKYDFEKWVYEYHEDVNEMSKVPLDKRNSFQEVQRAFSPGPWIPFANYPFGTSSVSSVPLAFNRKSKTKNSTIIWIIIIILLFVLISAVLVFLIFNIVKKQK